MRTSSFFHRQLKQPNDPIAIQHLICSFNSVRDQPGFIPAAAAAAATTTTTTATTNIQNRTGSSITSAFVSIAFGFYWSWFYQLD